MNHRDIINLAPQALINSALRIDAEVLCKDDKDLAKKYTSNNFNVYDLAINTWLLCIKEYAPYSWVAVATSIRTRGLIGTVKLFKTASDALVSGLELPPLPKSVYEEVNRRLNANVLAVEYQSTFTPDGIFLFICRYLKRLTPQCAKVLSDKAISDFKVNQRRLKGLSRSGYCNFIVQLCREEVDATIIRSRTNAWSKMIMADIEITPGVCYSLSGKKCRTLYDKQMSLVVEYGWDRLEVQRQSVWQFDLGSDAFLTTVPKTLFQARTIAPEQCLRQAIAHRMFSLCTETYPGIDLANQSVNQEYARVGSLLNSWATIDLSHASDDVTWVLVQEIYFDFPEYLEYLARIRPTYVSIDDAKGVLQSFATMGNSFTFINETEIFYIISKAAIHFAQRHGINCDDTVIAYGDDIIVAKEAYPYVVSFLTKLGFQVNEDKSYSEGRFRESCGKDYLDGEDVTSPYFPRKPLGNLSGWYRTQDGDLHTEAESLIALQHRLMDITPLAAQYIELFIRENVNLPLGTERIGAQSTDLWGYDALPSGSRLIPEYVWETKHTPSTWVWKLRNGTWHYVEERRLKKVLVDDDNHKIDFMWRPHVSVDTGEHNDSLVYLEYLRQGPYYATDLDRLLKVSTSRFLIPTGAPRSEWRRIER